MPYKRGSLKGQLTGPEIRKLIKAHNKLNTIKIPTGSKRDDLIKLVEKAGYKVNHKGQTIVRDVNKKEVITLSGAEKMFPKKVRKPKKVTMKKEDEVRPAEKPKPSAKPKAKKEDEVRPPRKAAPPIPKAKDFVKIGAKPKGQRVDTSGPRNVGGVVTAKEKKTITAEQEKRFAEIKARMDKEKKEKALNTFRKQWNNMLSKNYKWSKAKKDRIDDIVNNKKGIELKEVNTIGDGGFELVFDTPTSKGVKSKYSLPEINWGNVKKQKPVGPGAKKEEKKEEKKLNEVEKNRCIKAVNNARSVISLYEQKGGKIKDSDFSSKKDLMETIKDLKDMRPQLKLCSKSEQDIVDKALSLHSKGKKN
jgi:hypothetical protein